MDSESRSFAARMALADARRRRVLAVVLAMAGEGPVAICEHLAMDRRQIRDDLTAMGRKDLTYQFWAKTMRGGRVGQLIASEVENLAGESRDQVCKVLHRRPGSIARALHREGRHDLAAPFDRLAWRERVNA